MSYVDGFVIAVPTANREKFRKHAEMAAAIFIENGALSLAECWGDDVPDGKVTSFPMAVKLKEDETVVSFLDRLAGQAHARRRDGETDERSAGATGRQSHAIRRSKDDFRRFRNDREGLIRTAGSPRRRGDPATLAVADFVIGRSLADKLETRLAFAVMHQPAPFQLELVLTGFRGLGPPGFLTEDLSHASLRLVRLHQL